MQTHRPYICFRLMEELDKLIKHPEPETRAHAVMAMSAAGIKSDKTLRFLVEMLGLDSSDYVRLQVTSLSLLFVCLFSLTVSS